MQDPLKYLYICFGLFLIKVDSNIIDRIMAQQDWKSAPVYFRWSGTFFYNGTRGPCAIDQSTDDPHNEIPAAYPEAKGL